MKPGACLPDPKCFLFLSTILGAVYFHAHHFYLIQRFYELGFKQWTQRIHVHAESKSEFFGYEEKMAM
jgi:hypothetical protein